MALKEKVINLYKKVYHTDKEPSRMDYVKLANRVMQLSQFCPDTEEAIGKDVFALFKKCTKVNKRSVNVNATLLWQELDKQ